MSDEAQVNDSLDANVIDNLIYLEGHLKRKDINIIVELFDPKNDEIIRDFNINNTIISNKIISLLLSKLALYDDTASFYENLLTLKINEDEKDDQEVIIRASSNMFDETFPITFANKKSLIVSIYQAFEEKIIPFGYFREGILHIFSEKLHNDERITIESADLLVLMKL